MGCQPKLAGSKSLPVEWPSRATVKLGQHVGREWLMHLIRYIFIHNHMASEVVVHGGIALDGIVLSPIYEINILDRASFMGALFFCENVQQPLSLYWHWFSSLIFFVNEWVLLSLLIPSNSFCEGYNLMKNSYWATLLGHEWSCGKVWWKTVNLKLHSTGYVECVVLCILSYEYAQGNASVNLELSNIHQNMYINCFFPFRIHHSHSASDVFSSVFPPHQSGGVDCGGTYDVVSQLLSFFI